MAGQKKFKCKKSLPFCLLSSPTIHCVFVLYMNKLHASAGIPA